MDASLNLEGGIHFIFQSTKEGLHNTVVIAVTFSGHGLNDSMFLKFVAVESCIYMDLQESGCQC